MIRLLLSSILSRVWRVHRQYVMELDISGDLKKVDPLIPLSFRTATEEDILGMDEEATNFIPERKPYFVERLKKGDKCLLAFHQETLAGYLWLMYGRMELSKSVHMAISPDRAYIYNGFTRKEFRGKRVINALRSQWVDMLRADGKTCIVGTIYHDNASSLQSGFRTGYKNVGTIYQLRIFMIDYPYMPGKLKRYIQSARH
jgi:hypothetical protein